MKYYFIYFFLIFWCFTSEAQEIEVDTSNIAYKAKLMTMYRQGIADSTELIKTIQAQEIEFIKNPSKKIFLMKIGFSQTIHNIDGTVKPFFGSCYYYVAYSQKKNKFYRLGGFDTNDVVEFIDDIKSYHDTDQAAFLYSMEPYYGDFDISCILSYYEMSDKKRKRTGYKCFDKCSKKIFTEWKNMTTDKEKN